MIRRQQQSTNSTLINNGSILVGDFTTSHYGVAFVGHRRHHQQSQRFDRGHTGVYVDNGAFDIVNHGQIFGMVVSGVLLSTFGGTALTNDGEIFGELARCLCRPRVHGRQHDP